MMFRTAVLLVTALCLVPAASATVIMAGYSGCNGLPGSCPTGSYQLTAGGDVSSWTFDYKVPNSEVTLISYLNNVVAGLEVWDTGSGNNTSTKSFKVYLLVGGEDYSTLTDTSTTYSGLLGTVTSTLAGYTSGTRDAFTETLTTGSELSAFLTALQGSKGNFSIEVVDTEGTFNLGERHVGDDGVTPARFASLDYTAPEPASFGMAGFGLIALCWSLRKRIAR
jgi:hypothetical protein